MYYKKLIISVLLLWGGFVVILLILAFSKPKSTAVSTPKMVEASPTPLVIITSFKAQVTSMPLVPNEVPRVIGSVPKDGENDVAIFAPIVITFGNNFRFQELDIQLTPQTPFHVYVTGNELSLIPLNGMIGETNYTLTIIDKKTSKELTSLNFTTQNSTKVSEGSASAQEMQDYNDAMKTQSPDYYLANLAPLVKSEFELTSLGYNDTDNQYHFSVKLASGAKQEDFLGWLQGIGMLKEQIDKLKVEYK